VTTRPIKQQRGVSVNLVIRVYRLEVSTILLKRTLGTAQWLIEFYVPPDTAKKANMTWVGTSNSDSTDSMVCFGNLFTEKQKMWKLKSSLNLSSIAR